MTSALLEINLRSLDNDEYAVGMRFSMQRTERRLLPTEPTIRLNVLEGLAVLHSGHAGHGRWLGQQLFAADEKVLHAFREAQNIAAAQGLSLQIRLLIDGAARSLHQLHWETLRLPDTDTCWTEDANLLFARCLDSASWQPQAGAATDRLRVLVAIASPEDVDRFQRNGRPLAQIDAEAELARVQQSLGEVPQPEMTSLAGSGAATLDNIIDHLRDGYDCFYLVCHGTVQRDKSLLCLVDENNRVQMAEGNELVRRMNGILAEKRPRLAVMLSCQSSGSGQITVDVAANNEALSAVGPQLVESGAVPAVLAMQGDVPMTAGGRFIRGFFQGLQRGELIDQALAAARAQNDLQLDRWQPVLFLNLSLKHGQLWVAEETQPESGDPPFKGLAAFRAEDAHLFFGRDRLIGELVERLHDLDLLAVVGASGSGKSSVVRAGVVPVFTGTFSREGMLPPMGRWHPYVFTPTARPLDSLATALFSQQAEIEQRLALRNRLEHSPAALAEVLQEIASNEQVQPLLVVDQFEELFTQCKKEEERQVFIRQMLGAASGSAGCKVILTLRADFYSESLRYDRLKEILETQQAIVGAMSRDERRAAIVQPAEQGGWQFQQGLVELLLDEVADEPGALPLLSHALRETWERRRGRVLTLSGYREAGGIRGAIAETAEATYKQLTTKQKELARRVFLDLTELGEGTQDTRRRARVDQLSLPAPDDGDAARVIEILTRARLVTADKVELMADRDDEKTIREVDAYEVAHEALIREWPRLQEWLDQGRDGLRLKRQIQREATEWREHNSDPGYLTFRGARLENAVDTIHGGGLQLPTLSQQFINVCQEAEEVEERAREQAAREREEARQRELEQAEALAAEESRRSRTFRTALVVVGVLLIAAIGASIFASIQSNRATLAEATAVVDRNNALDSQRTAEAERGRADDEAAAAIQAQGIAEGERSRADENAAEAIAQANLAATGEAKAEAQALNAQTQALMVLSTSLLPTGRNPTENEVSRSLLMSAQALSQNLELVEPVSYRALEDQTRRLLADIGERPGQQVLEGHESTVNSVTFDPEGRWLVSGSDDVTIRLWDLTDLAAGPRVLTDGLFGSQILSVAIDPTGRWLASGDTVIRLRDLTDLAAEPRVLRHEDWVYTVAFDPEGRWLVSGGGDPFGGGDAPIRLWDLTDLAAEPRVLEGHEGPVRAVAFDPEGRWLASGSSDETIRLWDRMDLTVEPRVLEGHEGPVRAVAFDPEGRWLASGGDDATVRLWDLTDLDSGPRVLAGHEDQVNTVAFDPGGRWLASGGGASTAGGDATIRLWDLTDLEAEPLMLEGHEFAVLSVAFDPEGRWLVSGGGHPLGGGDAPIRLWDLTDLAAEPQLLEEHEDGVWSVAFDPERRWLASGGEDDTIRLWEVTDLAADPQVLVGHEDTVVSVGFDPEGRWLASASFDQTVRLWDLTDLAAEPRVLEGHQDTVVSVAFDPEGRWLASGSWDDTIRLWDLTDLAAEPQVLEGHEDNVVSVALDPGGRWLASGSVDQTVRLWDLTDLAAEPRVLESHQDTVVSVAFDPEGHWLASGGVDQMVRLWDLTDLAVEPQVLEGHEDWVLSVAFDPEGRWLASGSSDETVRLWDLTDLAAEPRVLEGHEARVFSVAFDPEGRWLASGSADDTIRLWRSLRELAIFACEQAGRNFTWKEWQQFFQGRPYEKTCNFPDRPSASFPVHCSLLDAPEEEWPAEYLDERALCSET